jgi:hypothetical protein
VCLLVLTDARHYVQNDVLDIIPGKPLFVAGYRFFPCPQEAEINCVYLWHVEHQHRTRKPKLREIVADLSSLVVNNDSVWRVDYCKVDYSTTPRLLAEPIAWFKAVVYGELLLCEFLP